MGNYCNQLPNGVELPIWGKANAIAGLTKSQELERLPQMIEYIPKGKVAVVVVDNGSWEAALVCDTQQALERPHRARARGDMRDYRVFLLDREDVEKMADAPLKSEEGI